MNLLRQASGALLFSLHTKIHIREIIWCGTITHAGLKGFT